MVFFAQSSGKEDVTCGKEGPGALGERFFASGNERTAVDLTELSYGYVVNKSETWNMVFHLANWESSSQTVNIKMTWKYATGKDAESREPLQPVWLDEDGCSTDSLITVPTGESDTHIDWEASFGGTGYVTPDEFEHISSMGVCTGSPIASFSEGDTLRLHTIYNNTTEAAIEDAMGIMIAYVG